MVEYVTEPVREIERNGIRLASYLRGGDENLDAETVESFGEEWNKFQQFTEEEIDLIGNEYFDIVPAEVLENAQVLDAGCGSGRWSRYMATRVAHIEAIDPNEAILAAARNNADQGNIRFTQAAIDQLPFPKDSFDLAVCLGVLHHIPDTQRALQSLTDHIKPGGKLLLYLYYALDHRPGWYKALFRLSNGVRGFVSSRNAFWKKFWAEVLTLVAYWPLVTLARIVGWFSKAAAAKMPLSIYADKSWTVMRNDALDRFGTPLEKRYTKEDIHDMLQRAGFTEVIFSSNPPFWHCLATKKTA